MEIRKILCAFDGSRRGRAAVEVAFEIARKVGATVTGLHVIDTAAFASYPSDLAWEGLRETLRQEGQRVCREFEEMARLAGVTWTSRVEEGHPAEVIVEVASEYDLVVMGTLGRRGLSHLLLGSVAERVIRHSPKPVLVVPLQEGGRSPRA